jgi:hypothetical protein
MYKGAQQNKRVDLVARVLGFSAALENSLDRALGTGGKKQYLQKWVDAILQKKPDSGKKKKKFTMSPSAEAFLSGGLPGLIPVIIKKVTDGK